MILLACLPMIMFIGWGIWCHREDKKIQEQADAILKSILEIEKSSPKYKLKVFFNSGESPEETEYFDCFISRGYYDYVSSSRERAEKRAGSIIKNGYQGRNNVWYPASAIAKVEVIL